MNNPFGSLLTAMITPFDHNLNVDYEKVAEIALLLIDKTSDGLVITGTTGESPSLVGEEKINIYKTVVEVVGNKTKVIAGTGGNSTRESIEMSCRAEETGVDGLMLVTPYYNKPTQDGLFQHFKSVAEAVSLPVMLYNVPGRTGVNLLPETCLRLAEIDNIVAVKEASGNLEQITSICAGAPTGFAVYSGDDVLTLPILSVGGHGVVSIASHILGPEIKEMISLYLSGNVHNAAKAHQFMTPMFNALFMAANPIPLKEALRLTGMDSGNLRLPLTALPQDMVDKLSALLQEYKLLS